MSLSDQTPGQPEHNHDDQKELTFDDLIEQLEPKLKEIETSRVTPALSHFIPDDEVVKICKKWFMVTTSPNSEPSIWIAGEELIKSNIMEMRIGKVRGLPSLWILYLLAGKIAAITYKFTPKDQINPLMAAQAIRMGIAKEIPGTVKIEKGWEPFFSSLDAFNPCELVDSSVRQSMKSALIEVFRAAFEAKDTTIADSGKELQVVKAEVTDLREKLNKQNEMSKENNLLRVEVLKWKLIGVLVGFPMIAVIVIELYLKLKS